MESRKIILCHHHHHQVHNVKRKKILVGFIFSNRLECKNLLYFITARIPIKQFKIFVTEGQSRNILTLLIIRINFKVLIYSMR